MINQKKNINSFVKRSGRLTNAQRKILNEKNSNNNFFQSQKNLNFQSLPVKQIMTKKPISIDKNELAAKALSLMNSKKITSLIVNNKKKPLIKIGVIHIHTILKSNIS